MGSVSGNVRRGSSNVCPSCPLPAVTKQGGGFEFHRNDESEQCPLDGRPCSSPHSDGDLSGGCGRRWTTDRGGCSPVVRDSRPHHQGPCGGLQNPTTQMGGN